MSNACCAALGIMKQAAAEQGAGHAPRLAGDLPRPLEKEQTHPPIRMGRRRSAVVISLSNRGGFGLGAACM